MPTPAEPSDARRPLTPDSPARSWLMFWVKLLSAMALILLGVFVGYRVVAHRALNERIQAVRDAGYPIELSELNDWYVTPEGENAADVFLRAFAAMPLNPDERDLPFLSHMPDFVLGEPLDPEMAQRIEDYLSLYDKTFELLEEVAQIEHSRFPGDYRLGINVLLPHLGPLRRSARILQLRCILDHDRGQHDRAADHCLTMLGLARTLDNEPLLISGLVNISILSLTYGHIEMLVVSGGLSNAKLQDLADALERIDVDRIMLRAMVGERCFIHGIFGDSDTLAGVFNGNGAIGRLAVGAWRTSGLLDIDHSSALDFMHEHVAFAENPTWPMPPGVEDIDNRVPRICVVTRTMIPALSASYRASRQSEARRRALLAGIAAERYRQAHGRLPAQLTDLVPKFLEAVPLDPFDDEPLRYRTEENGAIIYSLGADVIDHQGRQYNDGGSDYKDGTDIPVTFGGLQEQLWPLPEEEEEDWGGYGGYGDPYGGSGPATEKAESEPEKPLQAEPTHEAGAVIESEINLDTQPAPAE